jgi:small subunit ribosomal protein S27Ae
MASIYLEGIRRTEFYDLGLSALTVILAPLIYSHLEQYFFNHRLRRECPGEDCGAGISMAAHFDRQYCGKYGLTYMYNPVEDKVDRSLRLLYLHVGKCKKLETKKAQYFKA